MFPRRQFRLMTTLLHDVEYSISYRANPKHMSTTYLKSESQTLWTRNALRKSKAPVDDATAPQEQR